MMTHRVRTAAWVLLLLSLLPAIHLFWTQRDVPHFGFLLDDAIYHVSARSIAEGHGYRIESLPGAPAQTKYPPGYAALLSLVWRASPGFPGNLPLGLALNASAFVLLCLVLLPPLFRDLGLSSPWDLVLSAVTALNPPSIFYAASLMSETTAAVIFTAMLLAAARMPWAGGVLAGASILMRSASIVLLVAGPLWFVLRRQWRSALVYLLAALPFAALWTWWSSTRRIPARTPEFRYYTDYFGYLATNFEASAAMEVINANFGTVVTSVGSLLWFEPSDSLGASYGKTVLTLLAAAGVIKLFQARGASLYLLFSVGYCALLLPWNFSPNERFLLPLLPLLVAGLHEAVRATAGSMIALWRKTGVANRAFAGLLLAGLAAGGVLWVGATLSATASYFPAILQRERQRRAEEAPALAWVRTHVPSDATFIAYQESRFYLNTGRRAIGMPLPSRLGYRGTRKQIQDYFGSSGTVAVANGVRYLYVTPWDFELDLAEAERAQRAAGLAASPDWRQLWASGGFAVYELSGSPGVPGAPMRNR